MLLLARNGACTGSWARLFAAVSKDDALHTLLIDSTTVLAHRHASEARKKTDRKLGVGDELTSKLHVVADAGAGSGAGA